MVSIRSSQGPQARPAVTRPIETAILHLIWRERQISRTDIAQRLELSRSTVSGVVARLLRAGVVSETGRAPSRGGRRAIVLRFADEAACILGVEMGAAHVSVVLVDLRGRLITASHAVHPVKSDPAGTRRLIADLCHRCLVQNPTPDHALLGVGVAVPSPVLPDRPDGLSRRILPAWQGRGHLLDALESFGVPVLIDNDANLGALAEGWWPGHPGDSDVVFLKLATGVGSGRFVDGRIARGSTGEAGEIEHLVVDPHGTPCRCGRRGCLGTRVGRPALVALAHTLRNQYPESGLVGRELTIDALVEAAASGDPVGLQVAHDVADALGGAISAVINLINPAEVVVGGGIARLGDLLLAPVRERVGGRASSDEGAGTVVRTSRFGRETVAAGASALVLRRALNDIPWLESTISGRDAVAPST